MSRSPDWYFNFCSRVAHRVSRGVVQGVIEALEKRPIHLRLLMMRLCCSNVLRLVFDRMARAKSL